ncbi:hypothetical protein Bbelb_377370 [Branchiostoma belcheri]|nr:hypothetical protein Bbelb_377370 [Branchiostoma belcheri]
MGGLRVSHKVRTFQPAYLLTLFLVSRTSPTARRIARRPEGDPIRGRAGTESDAEYTARAVRGKNPRAVPLVTTRAGTPVSNVIAAQNGAVGCICVMGRRFLYSLYKLTGQTDGRSGHAPISGEVRYQQYHDWPLRSLLHKTMTSPLANQTHVWGGSDFTPNVILSHFAATPVGNAVHGLSYSHGRMHYRVGESSVEGGTIEALGSSAENGFSTGPPVLNGRQDWTSRKRSQQWDWALDFKDAGLSPTTHFSIWGGS